MSGHVCGCHTGGPLPSRGWGRVLPGPHSAQDAPRDDAAQCLPCRGGGPAESQEAPASMWGLRGSGRATGTCPGPGAAAKPGCTVGTRPDTGPSSPPSRRRHRPRAPGTAGHPEGGRGRWPPLRHWGSARTHTGTGTRRMAQTRSPPSSQPRQGPRDSANGHSETVGALSKGERRMPVAQARGPGSTRGGSGRPGQGRRSERCGG